MQSRSSPYSSYSSPSGHSPLPSSQPPSRALRRDFSPIDPHFRGDSSHYAHTPSLRQHQGSTMNGHALSHERPYNGVDRTPHNLHHGIDDDNDDDRERNTAQRGHSTRQDSEEEHVARSRPTMSISSILNDSKPPSGPAAPQAPFANESSDEAHKVSSGVRPSDEEAAPSPANAAAAGPPKGKARKSMGPRGLAATAEEPSLTNESSIERSSVTTPDTQDIPSKDQPEPSRPKPAKRGRGGRTRGSGRGNSTAAQRQRASGSKAAAAAAPSDFDTAGESSSSHANGITDLQSTEPVYLDPLSDANADLWRDELEAYKKRSQLRHQAIEDAVETQWRDQYLAVHNRVTKGYEVRLSAIVRKSQQDAAEQTRLKQEATRLRDEALRRRKQDELDAELLSTLADSSSVTTARGKGKGKGKGKVGAADVTATGKGKGKNKAGAASSDLASASPLPSVYDQSTYDDVDDSISLSTGGPLASTPTKKGKGKKRKLDELQQQGADVSSATSGRATPVKQEVEEQQTQAPEPTQPGEADIDPDGPAFPMDEKRVRQLEDAHRRIWVSMARKEIPKVYRVVQATVSARSTFTKRVAAVAQREARRGQARMGKQSKDVQQKARKAMREMLVFWRRNEKEEKELRRKADKEAADRLRKEEEMRETKRQARKLNFLITQTELYSHFVGNKLKTDEAEESEETSSGASKLIDPAANKSDAPASVPPVHPHAADLQGTEGADAEALKDIDFDDEDESNMRAHAARNAREAVAAAKDKAQAFDARAAEDRRKAEEAAAAADREGRTIEEKDLGKAFDSEDMNFQNPTSMGQMDITQPKMLTCQLKEYQLKGLNWLANLYEQGINGILADEMGLGKTVQSISLMSYLAEVHDIWGPFLVIAPSSTLHNWQQEITKFTPGLKALPYWGSVKDRIILRKFWHKKHMQYNRDSPFHVLITSYQLAVTDEKYFKRLKWQYMILDEAQAIKSSQSTRWRTLLSFNCRNRLLLTGTPVQNSMQELWALLHFIMPSLFDSHDEFSEWFSKDIEGHAENKGTLNEGQLRRLHMILKPFMLRRVKKNVQNELGDKIEIDVLCEMSARQKMLYRGLRENVSIAELMDRASNLQDEAGLKHLMNLVMQFRKVCNHPELFERADVSAPLTFGDFAQTASLAREGDLLHCPDSARNKIEYDLPKTIVRDGGLLNIPGLRTRAGFDTKYLDSMMNIWREPYVASSLRQSDSVFAPLQMLRLNGRDAETAFHGHSARKMTEALDREERMAELEPYLHDSDFAASCVKPMGRIRAARLLKNVEACSGAPALDRITSSYSEDSPLADPTSRIFSDKVVAPVIQVYSNDKPFLDNQDRVHRDQLVTNMLYGLPEPGCESEALVETLRSTLPSVPPRGVLSKSTPDQMPAAQMQVPQINKLIVDSSKLAHLDRLLRELKANDHRVLIYFQMTKMIDLMEEYLIYRQYKYLRLDGSSKISERRDMVTDWQTKPELFVFLLSTRAGGLGINLTAADTVIFFDSDWNPSNDQQAMDRAHRLGQTKQVTVYRLITRGTIDERIIKMARNKKEVQDMVVGNKTYNEAGMAKPQEIVSLLMDDDELADAMLKKRQADEAAQRQFQLDNLQLAQKKKKLKAAAAAADKSSNGSPAPAQYGRGMNGGSHWTLDEDEDDFFGAKPSAAKIEEIDAGSTSSKANGAKSKKKTGAGGVGSSSKKRPRPVDGGADESASGAATPTSTSNKKKKTNGKAAAGGKKAVASASTENGAGGEEQGPDSTLADLEASMLDE